MTQNSKLGLEPKKVSFCSPVQLSLLGRGVASVTLGKMTRYGEGREDDGVRRAFGFAASAMPDDAEYLAPEGNGLLPDFQITHASHEAKMAARGLSSSIDPTRFVSKPLCEIART